MVQAKVNTASEPAVLSFRHYMAGMDADISEVDAALRGAPYGLGFSGETSHAHLTSILRRAGHDIEMMQAIQLMCAEFNMNNKKLGRMP
jgi:hypothetical protein